MKRVPRIEGEALTYYISSYGRKGTILFRDDKDRLYFINLLRQQKIKSNNIFYGYCLLSKQYSCLMETSTNNLTKTMHQINSHYANYFNRRHKRKDRLFKDRYRCYVVDKKNYLAEVSCNLHLLPKKVKVAESAFQYKWSSLPGYLNRKKRQDWIDYDYILSKFKGKSKKTSINYRHSIKEIVEKRLPSPFAYLKGSTILGSESFKREVFEKHRLNEIDPQKEEAILARKIAELVTQSPSWSILESKRKKFNLAILSRNAAIYFVKKYTNLNNQEISTYFSGLEKSSISQMSRRFNLTIKENKTVKKISNLLEEDIKRLIENNRTD